MRVAKVETFELEGQSRLDEQERGRAGERLSQRSVDDFWTFWCDVPSRLGLKSSMANQMARLEQLSGRPEIVERAVKPRTKRPVNPTKATAADALLAHLAETEQPDELAQRADTELAKWRAEHPEHVALDLPPEELPEVRMTYTRTAKREGYAWWNLKDGLHGDRRPGDIRAAGGVRPDFIHCASAGTSSGASRLVTVSTDFGDGMRHIKCVELVAAPLPMESYCDPWSGPASELRKRVRTCRRALLRMIRQGDAELVGALYRVYGGEMPDSDFRGVMGKEADLAPLLVDTRVVLAHAAMMTRKLRASLGSRRIPAHGNVLEHWEPCEVRRLNRRETVTPLEAARDLFGRHNDSAERVEARASARSQARSILVDASEKYEIAHAQELQAMKAEAEVRRVELAQARESQAAERRHVTAWLRSQREDA